MRTRASAIGNNLNLILACVGWQRFDLVLCDDLGFCDKHNFNTIWACVG